MRNEPVTLRTAFWTKAAASLPAAVRRKHLKHIERAERVEVVIDAIFAAWAQAKAVFGRTFHIAAHH